MRPVVMLDLDDALVEMATLNIPGTGGGALVTSSPSSMSAAQFGLNTRMRSPNSAADGHSGRNRQAWRRVESSRPLREIHKSRIWVSSNARSAAGLMSEFPRPTPATVADGRRVTRSCGNIDISKVGYFVLVFLDTEFTSFDEPYLISAGLVAGSREFYFEIAGITSDICTPFVRQTVLPLLGGPVLRPIEVSNQLATFLAPCGPDVTFFCDAPRYDIELLRPFLPASLRWNYAVPSFAEPADEEKFNRALEGAFQGRRRHHALDDARALAHAWRESSKCPS